MWEWATLREISQYLSAVNFPSILMKGLRPSFVNMSQVLSTVIFPQVAILCKYSDWYLKKGGGGPVEICLKVIAG